MITNKTVITLNGLSGVENYEKIRGETLFVSRHIYNELSSAMVRPYGDRNSSSRVDKFISDMEVINDTNNGANSTNETDLYLGTLGITNEYPHQDRRRSL